MNIFVRDIISGLPIQKKSVYQYIESMEDRLASQCETKEEFLNLLVEKSPYHQAATHFHMSADEMYELMKEIEDEINSRLDMKIERCRWLDYTDKLQDELKPNMRLFLFVS